MSLMGFQRRRRELAKRKELKKQKTKEQVNLEQKTVKELREMAKEKGIVGYSDMNKTELTEALEE